MKRKRKLKYKKVITDEEVRHEKNLVKLNKENEEISKENEKKYFKKYVAYYWQRKKQEKELKKRKKIIIDKLSEKREKLLLLEKMNEIKRKDILKKIQAMDLRKKEGEKIREKKFLDKKIQREERFKSCEERRNDFLLEESERRQDILDYQTETLARCLSKDKLLSMKKSNAHEKTSFEQLLIEKDLMAFNKQMNVLKSQSMLKKSFNEKLKIFRE